MKLLSDFVKSRLSISLLLTFFLSLLASRCWQQLISPQVWDEDGTKVLYGFINHGWFAFFEPVNGYLITVPKIISAISLGVSFSSYPIVSTIFTWLFIASIGLAITLTLTNIRGRFFCAIVVS